MQIKLTSILFYFRKEVLSIIMRTFIFLFCTTAFSFTTHNILSQNAEIVINTDMIITVDEVFTLIKEQTTYRFIYKEDMFKDYPKVSIKKGVIKANDLLNKSLSNGHFGFHFISKNNIVIKKNQDSVLPTEANLQYIITGKITDENGIPLPGVSIFIKDFNTGVISDFDGKYTIKIPDNLKQPTLVFSFLGYTQQEIKVNGQQTLNVEMVPDVASLKEVVVIGYGTRARKDITGASATLDPEVLKTTTFPTIGSMIQGTLPGVQVISGTGEPGSPVRIRIRGEATINEGSDPLIVINDVPMPNDFNLNDINPNDVESLHVLKDASATAIYGSRALAGVIQITTKRGSKYTKPRISYIQTTSIKGLEQKINALDGDQFRDLYDEGLINYISSRYDVRDRQEAIDYTSSTGLNWYSYYQENADIKDASTDWVDLLLRNSISSNHYFSLLGGDEKIQYAFSFGLHKEDGVLVGTSFKRNSLNFNYDHRFSDKVKVGFRISGGTNTRAGGTATIGTATNRRPDIQAFNDDGSYFIDTYIRTSGPPWAPREVTRARDNPLVLAKEVTNDRLTRNITLSPYAEIELLKNIKLTTRYSYYLSLGEGETYYPSFSDHSLIREAQGVLDINETGNTSTIFTNFISYLKSFKDHDISGTLGMEHNKSVSSFRTDQFQDFPDDYILNTPGNAGEHISGSDSEEQTSSIGYFARLNYKYQNKYLFSGSFRVDGSSRFGVNNRYGIFPSIGLGYIITEEPFLKPIKNVVNHLKIRLSAGKSGNDRVGAYTHLARYTATNGNYLEQPGIVAESIGNPDLKWETSTEYNAGLDFGFMKHNRIKGSIDIYKKDIEDMLVYRTLPQSTGADRVRENLGSITNKGIEIALSGVIIQGNDLSWDMGINLSKNQNVLNKVGHDRITAIDSGSLVLGDYLYEEGQPLGQIFGYKTDGLFRSYEEIDQYNALNPDRMYQETFWRTLPGHIKFVDTNGDGFVNETWRPDEPEDRVVIGNTQPDFTGGVYMNFQYKGVRLNVRSTFQLGGDKYWKYGERQFGMGSNSNPSNVDAIALERWTPENPNAKYPSFQHGYFTNKTNDFWVYDASHFKIQEIVLSYDLPNSLLEKTHIFRRVNIFTSINNVATFTKYPGYGIGEFETDPSGRGAGSIFDYSSYPQERVFRLGVKIDF